VRIDVPDFEVLVNPPRPTFFYRHPLNPSNPVNLLNP